MNLIGDPWIPVLFASSGGNGSSKSLVGLWELYQRAGELRDLAVTPTERIALTRLLLCITQAALGGVPDEETWRNCLKRIVSESLAYLDSRRQKFELFGEQPFLQVAALKATENATVDKLDLGLAAGNSPTLFDQESIPKGRVHDESWLARQLLTFQCFSPGGRIGSTSWSGKSTGSGESQASPCLESSPLLSLVRGPRLLNTIHLNLVTTEMLAGEPLGEPIWDRFPNSQRGKSAEAIGRSYLGRLVPLSRAIVLNEDRQRMTLANGLSYPKFPEGRDAMATVILRGSGKNQEPAYLRINLGKHPWRELSAVLATGNVQHVGSAYALRHLIQSEQECFDLWVGGLVTNKAKIIDAAEWTFTVPKKLLFAVELALYTSGVTLANGGEQSLRTAVKEYCAALKLETEAYTTKAIPIYWSILDAHCTELIGIANSGADLESWRRCCWQTMVRAFEEVCPHTTPRQIEAFAAGRKLLRLKQAFQANEEGGAE